MILVNLRININSGQIQHYVTPCLAIVNGRTVGLTAMNSIQGLSAIQVNANISSKTSFIVPATEIVQRLYGDNKVVIFATAFFNGACCSFVGQGPKTWQVRNQKGECRRSKLPRS